jgi:cullin-associated NEDD8-dissociated protein 1
MRLSLVYLSYDPNFTDTMDEDTDNEDNDEDEDEYGPFLSSVDYMIFF